MNFSRIITIICWAIAAVVLAGLAIWFLTGSLFGLNTDSGFFSFGIGNWGWERLSGQYELVGSYSADVKGLDSLYIDWVSGDVTVEPYDGSDIKISEYAQRELKDDEKLSLKTTGGTLTIDFHEKRVMWNMPSKKLEVLIPRELSEHFEKLTADSTSGRIFISDMNAETFIAGTVSGGIELTDITSKTLTADSTSGAILISNATADKINLESVSGSIELSNAQAQELRTDSTSGAQILSGSFGDVELNSVSGRLSLDNSSERSNLRTDSTSGAQDFTGSFDDANLNSVSGTIKILSTVVPSSLETDTTSGSVTVTIPNEGQVSVYHSATSGKLSSDIPTLMQNSGAQFRFSTTSGSVKILALD